MKLSNAAYAAIAVAAARKIVRKARGERPRKKVIVRSVPPPDEPLADYRIVPETFNPFDTTPLTGKYRVVNR